MKKLKRKNGITLISLVVTIVVLLILAGVSIAMHTGQNGILNQATQAQYKTDEAQEKEGVKLAVTSSKMEDISQLEITKPNLENALKSQFGNNVKFTVSDNGDGSFTIRFDDTNRIYYVENSGNIIESANILEIGSAEELKDFRDDVNNGNTYEEKYVYLTNDITLNINEEWKPIGLYLLSNSSIADETNLPFMGTFDGKGHEINGIKITSADEEKGKGLFGFIQSATIKNLGIGEDCNISAGISCGGIVGYSYSGSLIKNCYNKASITASLPAENNESSIISGGIVGSNNSNSSIMNCYNLGTVNSTKNTIQGNAIAGGIAGQNYGNIVNSYNIGNVISNYSYVGGITGFQRTGSSISNSYFLEQTVNGTNGTVLLGTEVKTETYMKSQEFVDLLNINNTTNIWKKNTNEGYPVFEWQ